MVGTIVDIRKIPSEETLFRLLIYCNAPQELLNEAVSVNRSLASELIAYRPSQRTRKLESCFLKLLQELPDNAVIKDIDVLFDPEYKIDVIKMLLSVYKCKRFRLIWSGSYADGKLRYGEEGSPDHKIYDINEYDIICVI